MQIVLYAARPLTSKILASLVTICVEESNGSAQETLLGLKEKVKLCSFYISPLIGPVSIRWVHIIVDMIMKSTICDPAWSDGSVGNSSSEKLSRVTKVLNCWRQNLSFLRDLDADKGVCEVECKFLRDLNNLWILSIWSNPISKNQSIFKTSPSSLWWGICVLLVLCRLISPSLWWGNKRRL